MATRLWSHLWLFVAVALSRAVESTASTLPRESGCSAASTTRPQPRPLPLLLCCRGGHTDDTTTQTRPKSPPSRAKPTVKPTVKPIAPASAAALLPTVLIIGSIATYIALRVLTGIRPEAAPLATELTPSQILQKAWRRALGGGLSGAAAGTIQVATLMWLRTTMNHQYRYGTSTMEALTTLYREGGVARLYQGVQFALLQAPLARFGDTAANSGILALLAHAPLTVGERTACASLAAALWRIALTPLDTLKTTLQVEGSRAYAQLMAKTKTSGPGALYEGAGANAIASFVSSYPWWFTFNFLSERVPLAPAGKLSLQLGRSALIGLCAACTADVLSNSLRVVKTSRQTSAVSISYAETVREILKADGLGGLLGRGLKTRLITNGLQASLFTVLWKLMEDRFKSAGL